jgi:hypothetical protein
MMGGMDKTTVYLTSQQKAALAQAAQAAGRSEAALIRAGIDAVVSRHRVEAPSAPVGSPGVGERAATAGVRPRWIHRASYVALILRSQADAGLREELRDLAPGTTDDQPLP